MRAEEQANVFGFACSETESLMPLPISLAHGLARALAEARSGEAPWLAPDAKTQVAVKYHDGRPSAIHSITLTVSVTEKARRKLRSLRPCAPSSSIARSMGKNWAWPPIRPST
jgi:S-adenosylmethionine synthetase